MRRRRIFILAALMAGCMWGMGAMEGRAQDKTFVLTEDNKEFGQQSWFYSTAGKDLEQDRIKKHWDEDKYITAAAYTKNGWFVCMSVDKNYTAQAYNYVQNFPSDWRNPNMSLERICCFCCDTHRPVAFSAGVFCSASVHCGSPQLTSARQNPLCTNSQHARCLMTYLG